jgi:hypothetical protein
MEVLWPAQAMELSPVGRNGARTLILLKVLREASD